MERRNQEKFVRVEMPKVCIYSWLILKATFTLINTNITTITSTSFIFLQRMTRLNFSIIFFYDVTCEITYYSIRNKL